MADRVCLDLTRSAQRAGGGQPTGIDRVERSIADALPDNALIVVRDRRGARLIPAGERLDHAPLARASHHGQAALIAHHAQRYRAVGHNLPPAEVLAELKRGNVHISVMVHDIIPLTHPAFATPASRAKARRQWPAVARFADHVEHLTETGARRWADLFGAPPRHQSHTVTAPPCRTPTRPLVPKPGRPIFLAVGTVEPRKNYDLLLSVWERLALHGARPVLHVVGRAGWAAPATLDRLAAASSTSSVIWHRDLDDDGLDALMQQSSALLFPSLAEGYGLPVCEARSVDLPVIACDLPELAELHGSAIIRLPTDDVDLWTAAVEKKLEELTKSPSNTVH